MRIKPVLPVRSVSVWIEEGMTIAGCQFNLLVSGRQLPEPFPHSGFSNSLHPICQERENADALR